MRPPVKVRIVLGSPESRAIARALAQTATAISPEDSDCLLIAELMEGRTVGGAEFWESAIGRRATELHARFDANVCANTQNSAITQTLASIAFKHCSGQEPEPGQVLRRSDVERIFTAEMRADQVRGYREAWDRRCWDKPFPLRLEADGSVSRLETSDEIVQADPSAIPQRRRCTVWAEVKDNPSVMTADRWWKHITYDADADPATTEAVIFIDPLHGKYRCRPATAEEIQAAEAAC